MKLNWNFQRGEGGGGVKKSLPWGRYGFFLELHNTHEKLALRSLPLPSSPVCGLLSKGAKLPQTIQFLPTIATSLDIIKYHVPSHFLSRSWFFKPPSLSVPCIISNALAWGSYQIQNYFLELNKHHMYVHCSTYISMYNSLVACLNIV